MNAPIEALQGLANAAAEAAAGVTVTPPRWVFLIIYIYLLIFISRVKKRRRVEPPPGNAFPSVLEKVQTHRIISCVN